MAGTVTVPFDKIKELKSGAAVRAPAQRRSQQAKPRPRRHHRHRRRETSPSRPLPTEPPAVVPAADVNHLIDHASFDSDGRPQGGFLAGWNGALTGGATIVRSTTTGTTLTAGLNLIRAMPTVPWLPPAIAPPSTSPKLRQDHLPRHPAHHPAHARHVVVSSIFHADAERDEYFSPRLYALGDASFDHNYAQGLQLQQVYGGGLGCTPIKSAKQQLDLKADVHYEKQQYISTTATASSPHAPASTSSAPPSSRATTATFPARSSSPKPLTPSRLEQLQRLLRQRQRRPRPCPSSSASAATIAVTDNFLNDPAPVYKKNSFQFITGVTYVLP